MINGRVISIKIPQQGFDPNINKQQGNKPISFADALLEISKGNKPTEPQPLSKKDEFLSSEKISKFV